MANNNIRISNKLSYSSNFLNNIRERNNEPKTQSHNDVSILGRIIKGSDSEIFDVSVNNDSTNNSTGALEKIKICDSLGIPSYNYDNAMKEIYAVIAQEGGGEGKTEEAIKILDVMLNRLKESKEYYVSVNENTLAEKFNIIDNVIEKHDGKYYEFVAYQDPEGNQAYKNYIDNNGNIITNSSNSIYEGKYLSDSTIEAINDEIRKFVITGNTTYDYNHFIAKGDGIYNDYYREELFK